MRSPSNTTPKLVRGLLLTLLPFVAACGSRGDPRPPVYPNPPAITDLTVAQRGASAILRFAPPPPIARVNSEDVELENIEVLVYGERYPLINVETLIAGLERRRDVMAEDAAAEAAAALALAAVEAATAAGQPPPPDDDPNAPATMVQRRTPDEDLLYRLPRDLRDEWREEGLAPDTALAEARRLVTAVDTLWARLNLPNTVLPTGQPQPLPSTAEIAAASVPLLQSEVYERPLDVDVFLRRAAVSRRVPVDQMDDLRVDGSLQVAIPVGSASTGSFRTRYFFAVRGVSTRQTPGEVAALSALAPAAVPVPPSDVSMQVGPNGVELSWRPPAGDLALRRLDADAIRYNVYRMSPDDIAGPQPINATPVLEPSYTDNSMEWGRNYVYEVRALLAAGGTIQRESEGAKTEPLRIVDRYPPAPPTDINPTRAGRRVTLQWTPSVSIDLTGYRVYRHPYPAPEVPIRFDPTAIDEETGEPTVPFDPASVEPSESNEMVEAGWLLLTEDPVPFSRYTDADADPSVRYVYAVEAIDGAGNLSALGVGTEAGDDES